MGDLAQLADFDTGTLSLIEVSIQLGIGILLSLVLRWHFRRFGSPLCNVDDTSMAFPFVLLTTLLVINVVKSSLALSLGLVGALSIVRFRTPIKEPEELAYLFLAIAIGLGLGAHQIAVTLLATAVILTTMAVLKGARRKPSRKNLYLSVALVGTEGDPAQYDEINRIVAEHADDTDLQRLDSAADGTDLTYFVRIGGTEAVSKLTQALRDRFPGIQVTFIDQPRIPGV